MQYHPQVYAIDFGTSNSLVVAASSTGQVSAPLAIDPSAADPSILRSIIHFPEAAKQAHWLFGQEALDGYAASGMQGRLLRSLKRFLPDPGFTATIIGGRKYRLEELIGSVLRVIRTRANALFGADVDQVLLGRPARYAALADHDKLAEDRMRAAAELAGFRHIEFFPEPVAAARDFETDLSEQKLVLVADFGGGTSDYTVVRMDRNGFTERDVLATGGVSVAGDALDGALMRRELSRHFGGDVEYQIPMGRNVLSMPAALMEMLCTPAKLPLLQAREVQEFLRDIRDFALSDHDKALVERLLIVAEDGQGFNVFESVERVKRLLSSAEVAPFVYEYADIEVRQDVTREQFERASASSVAAIAGCLDETLASAGVSAHQIDLVCLTGGTSRVPRIARMLEERFGDARLRRLKGLHSVAIGLGQEAQRRLAT